MKWSEIRTRFPRNRNKFFLLICFMNQLDIVMITRRLKKAQCHAITFIYHKTWKLLHLDVIKCQGHSKSFKWFPYNRFPWKTIGCVSGHCCCYINGKETLNDKHCETYIPFNKSVIPVVLEIIYLKCFQ